MCKLIADLVGNDLDVVRETVRRLEQRSGSSGVDISLISEIHTKVNLKLRELGLDPQDTTSEELYMALMNITALHDSFLKARFGMTAGFDNSTDMINKITSIVNGLDLPKTAWVLKPAALRKLLSDNPPKTLQKLLGYRSTDSLLKREQLNVLLPVAFLTESQTWQQKLKAKYKALTPMDFEAKSVDIRFMDQPKWQPVASLVIEKTHGNIAVSVEAGSVTVFDTGDTQHVGLTLLITSVILQAVNEIRTYATYFKFHQMLPDFGSLLVDILFNKKSHSIDLAGQPVNWRVLHRHYGKKSNTKHPEIFQPHVQPEDLAFRRAESVLYKLEPALHFWNHLDYIGLAQPDGPVSLNLMDNIISLVNDLPYQARTSTHLSDALWDELYARYLAQDNIEAQLLEQLDETVVQPIDTLSEMEFAL